MEYSDLRWLYVDIYDLDLHQNLMGSSVGAAPVLHKMSCKSVEFFLYNPAAEENITSLVEATNKLSVIVTYYLTATSPPPPAAAEL